MTDKDVRQELITQQDAERWEKILRGELTADSGKTAEHEAEMVRAYLVHRDQNKAIQSLTIDDIRNTIPPEQARQIYQKASQAIHRRSEPGIMGPLKPYLLGGLIGILISLIAYLIFADTEDLGNGGLTSAASSAYSVTNKSHYTAIKPGKLPTQYPVMVLVSGGRFTMGCSAGWDDIKGCKPHEYPEHEVVIQSFDLARHEVTVRQFGDFVADTGYKTTAESDSQGCGLIETHDKPDSPIPRQQANWQSPGFAQETQFPVTCVSWVDAHAYIDWLSQKTGDSYRLPSEAEWEYAARGARVTAYFWGSQADPAHANYKAEAEFRRWPFTAPIGSYPANTLHLHDTAGNVEEWVEDCWHPTYMDAPADGSAWTTRCADPNKRGLRGGSWASHGQNLRAANRDFAEKRSSRPTYGFRVARSLKAN